MTLSAVAVTAQDRTSDAGLAMITRSYGGVVADFDLDGYVDAFINRHVEDVPRLMLGSGTGSFSEASGAWMWQDRHGCDVADVDLDGRPDLYCSVGANEGTRATGNELVLHPGFGDGAVATSEFGVLNAWARGRHATFLNLDGNEAPDLYVTAQPERIDALQSANRLFRNVDGRYFAPVESSLLNRSMGGNCVVASDFDGDGDDDLFVCVTQPVDGLQPGARLFVNTAGVLTDRTQAWGIAPTYDSDIEVADFDGDGTLDFAQLRKRAVHVSLQRDGRFVPAFTYPTAFAAAMAVGDVNGDGRPDLYVAQRTAGNDDHLMLVNDGTGTSVTSIGIPQASFGSADDVLSLDYDGNGLTDFLVLNGLTSPGPVKLIAFFRSE